MTTTFPDIAPDRNSVRTKQFKVLRADFGDGYAQTAPDGINNYTLKWDLSFANYPAEDVDAIANFLDDRGANESFYWTEPFSDAPTLWKQVGEYKITYPGGLARTLTVTIQQVPL